MGDSRFASGFQRSAGSPDGRLVQGGHGGRGLNGAIGFDSHMERRDWESAKNSIERTYGRSSRAHQLTLDTLSAAIQNRRMLGPRFTG